MKDENFIRVYASMVYSLKLNRNNLLVFALIHGYSKGKNKAFYGSLKYIGESLCISKSAVISSLKYLCKMGYLTKNMRLKNGVKTCMYKSNFDEILGTIIIKPDSHGLLKNKQGLSNIDPYPKLYKEQLNDMRWKKLANKIRKRDKYTCQMCGNHKTLQVHHKHYIKGKLAWEYEDSNFITLCRDCHKEVHNIK